MGQEGMKKFGDLYAECCEPSQHQLFAFNPHQSYVQEEWIKADPSFWKPTPLLLLRRRMPRKRNRIRRTS